MTPDRLPGRFGRWLYAAGSRGDRLRDPDAVIEALDVHPGMIVGDLGPGAGHFTIRLARAVAPGGVVYALDANQDTLDDLEAQAVKDGITNLTAVRVPRDRLEIPQPVDLLFVSATYHHLPNRSTYFAAARAHLRPDARVAILESRREGLLARWLAPHASSPDQVLRELTGAGYRLTTTHDIVRGHLFVEFAIAD